MDNSHLNPINLAAFAMSAVALGVALLALFPGLKGFLTVARDAVLWLALFFVIGGAGFFGWQQWQQPEKVSAQTQTLEKTTPLAPGFTTELATQ